MNRIEEIIENELKQHIDAIHEICSRSNVSYVMVIQKFDMPPEQGAEFAVSANLLKDDSTYLMYDLYDVATAKAVAVKYRGDEEGRPM